MSNSSNREPDLAAKRRLRRARYAWEDFADAVHSLQTAAKVAIGLALVQFLVSLLFGADNIDFAMATGLVGAGLLWSKRGVTWSPPNRNVVGAITYLSTIVAEIAYLGWPDVFVPVLADPGLRPGVLVFANALTPLIYLGVRVTLVYPFVKMYVAERKLRSMPEVDRERTRPRRLF